MIRTGLVSFGMASRVFHAPLISAVPGLELAAVVERNRREAEQIYPGLTTYSSLEAMLADKSIELVVIATPNATHAPLALKALSAGRHVVVDKPVGITSREVLSLIEMAANKSRMVIPFHNRRWDSDFRTIQQLLHEPRLGNVYYFESTFDRWRPQARRNMWKENGDPGGGNLQDLGTHIVDQALVLFGLPQGVSADIVTERENAVTDDAFTVRLRYPGRRVILSSNCMAPMPRPRFTLRGTKGSFVKYGLDPQENRLKENGTGSESTDSLWGEESATAWGSLAVMASDTGPENPNALEISRVESMDGDYRLFYQGVAEAIAGKSDPPVLAKDALNVAKILEWAKESSAERREVICKWPHLASGQPSSLRSRLKRTTLQRS